MPHSLFKRSRRSRASTSLFNCLFINCHFHDQPLHRTLLSFVPSIRWHKFSSHQDPSLSFYCLQFLIYFDGGMKNILWQIWYSKRRKGCVVSIMQKTPIVCKVKFISIKVVLVIMRTACVPLIAFCVDISSHSARGISGNFTSSQ